MLFKNFSHKIIEARIELRVFFYHNFVDNLGGLVLHNLMNPVIR